MSSHRSWESFPQFHQDIQSYLLNTLKFAHPTPTQASSIPLLLGNKDVAVEAATGSGKSLAFALPLVQRLLSRCSAVTEGEGEVDSLADCSSHQVVIRALIMSPTRELAQQIADVVEHLVANCPVLAPLFTVACLYGGRPEEQEKKLLVQRTPQAKSLLVVGTPGRIRYVLDKTLLRECEYLVLDEADRLFDKSFAKDVQVILSMLPKQRRTYLFSATLPTEGSEIVRLAGMRNPALVRVKRAEGSTLTHDMPSTLSNFHHVLRQQDKLQWLVNFAKQSSETSDRECTMVVFFLTCASVEYHHAVVAKLFPELKVAKLHGKMTQSQRNKTLTSIRQTAGLLFCTDLVARGIDLPQASWIVQFDCPQDVSFFVHRVGRTARAGRAGSAVCLLLENEHQAYIAFLNQRGVPLVPLEFAEERPAASQVNELVADIRTKLTTVDREFLNKSSAAFVSFVRAYQEHQLRYIFSLKELALGDVALSFACPQLPRVKEILGKKVADWVASEVKSDSVPFLDKAKEARRLDLLKKKVQDKLDADAAAVASSKTRKALKAQAAEVVPTKEHQRTRSEKRETKRKAVEDEWEELQEEERMAKKLKKGKISKKEFDKWLLKKDSDLDSDTSGDESATHSSSSD